MTYKLERALQKIASLNSNTQGLEDARKLALQALDKDKDESYWNHRLVEVEPGCIRVCEVFYNGRGEPCAYDEGAVAQGDSPEEVAKDLAAMMGALGKPTMKPEEFTGKLVGEEMLDVSDKG